jgi:hypothetical protein
MQIQNGTQVTLVSSSGKQTTISAITPNFDGLSLDKNAPKLSVEYAKARTAVNLDYAQNHPRNQALAKRVRRACKDVVVDVLGGKVSKTKVTDDKAKDFGQVKLLVTFPDQSVARL